jgi:hypothetical protein
VNIPADYAVEKLRNKTAQLQFGLSKEAHSTSLYQSPSALVHTVKFPQMSPALVKRRGQRDKRATKIAGLKKMYVFLHKLIFVPVQETE